MSGQIQVDLERRLGDFDIRARFTAEEAGITALFGESGAGKSSVIAMIAGLLRPDRGRITVGDAALFDSAAGIDRPAELRRTGCVFQDARLFPHMNVRANLLYGHRRTLPGDRLVAFDHVVGTLDLGRLLRRRVHNLSGGERQRVAIGRALLRSPRLLLMDEPLASLDAPRRAEIIPLIEHLRDAFAVPIIYVSHRFDEIARLAERLVLIRDGAVTAEGPLEEMLGGPDGRDDDADILAGTVIQGRLAGRDGLHGLARLSIGGGHMMIVPDPGLPEGSPLRVHVRARDVSIALSRPADISILNIFPGTVAKLREPAGPHTDVGVRLDGGEEAILWARLTRCSALRLRLRPGLAVTALVKAVAVDPLGRHHS